MIHEDFRLNPEQLEPRLDLSDLAYAGPFPIELYVLDQARQLVLHHRFERLPLWIVHPNLRRGDYYYRIQRAGTCLREGELRFP